MNQERLLSLLPVVAKVALRAERYQEGIERLEEGFPLDSSWLAGPRLVLLKAAPGLGKTFALVRTAEDLWDRLPVLHLGPTHSSFANVDRRKGWDSWHGHDDGRRSGTPCPKWVRIFKGYDAGNECNCDAESPRFTGVPAFGHIEYIQRYLPQDYPPDPEEPVYPAPAAREATMQYACWVLDDVGLDRFVGKVEVTERDLQLTSAHYPVMFDGAEAVKTLAQACLDLLQDHTLVNMGRKPDEQESWGGLLLYDRLDAALRKHHNSVREMLVALNAAEFSNQAWSESAAGFHQDTDPKDWPRNFMPTIRPKLVAELSAWSLAQDSGGKQSFHPQVHIAWDRPEGADQLQSILRVRWLRRPSLARPILILDATGNIDLLKTAFRAGDLPIEESDPVPIPPFPAEIQVTQHWATQPSQEALRRNPASYLPLVLAELAARRAHWTGLKPPTVGLITFRELVGSFHQALEEAGFTKPVTDHYWNMRSRNDFSYCDYLVLVGYPVPDPQGLYEEACVLFSEDDAPISRERQEFEQHLALRNGRSLLVSGIPGYADLRLQALYQKKSLSELYRSIHRARPFGTTSVKEVLVFTDVPIEGVPVDGFFERHGRVFDTLTWLLLETGGDVTVPQLVDAVLNTYQQFESSQPAVDAWVRRPRNATWLADATGAEYVLGKSKNEPGRFRAKSIYI